MDKVDSYGDQDPPRHNSGTGANLNQQLRGSSSRTTPLSRWAPDELHIQEATLNTGIWVSPAVLVNDVGQRSSPDGAEIPQRVADGKNSIGVEARGQT